METCSRSKGDPTRSIGSKLKKKCPPVKDAAHAVPPESSGVERKHDTTVVAKKRKTPDAAAVANTFANEFTIAKQAE